MHIHILGICGTFMGGVAALARAAGHTVTGSDRNIYPPMSTQLEELGIRIFEGWDPDQLTPAPDCVVVGNVMSRGNPLIEEMLDRELPFTSGPAWLSEHVLRDRRVIAISGTHGKTTTASLIAWILEEAGLKPGFLIGGVPANFGRTARYGEAPFFIVEADEYDTAFFDKRAKFVHYRPEIAVLNNLEFDHADIYSDLAAIRFQFHQLLRIVPRKGKVIVNKNSPELAAVLRMGVWSPVESFAANTTDANLTLSYGNTPSSVVATVDGVEYVASEWPLSGEHNLENAAAALSAARAIGISIEDALTALRSFQGVRRRLELIVDQAGIRVYDDFAHHPTAIAKTIEGVRRIEPAARIVVALEPRSNTMRLGVHANSLSQSLSGADEIFVYKPETLTWDLVAALQPLGDRCRIFDDYQELGRDLMVSVRTGDVVILMSNGSFGGLRERIAENVANARPSE